MERIFTTLVFGIGVIVILANNLSFATPIPPSSCSFRFQSNLSANTCPSQLAAPSQSSASRAQCPDGDRPRRNQRLSPDASSTCPWYYTTDYRADRIPANIEVANCLCDGNCLNPNNSQKNELLTCQKVKYTMKVLIRDTADADGTDGDDSVQYSLQDYEVPVACACMRIAGP